MDKTEEQKEDERVTREYVNSLSIPMTPKYPLGSSSIRRLIGDAFLAGRLSVKRTIS